MPYTDGALLALGTGALCVLGYEHALPVIVSWNLPAGEHGFGAGNRG